MLRSVSQFGSSIVLGLLLVSPVMAQPSAMQVLPKETLLLVRTGDAQRLVEGFKTTAVWRMIQDPQLKPLFEHLYGSARDFYQEEAAEEVGLSLKELREIPQGEIAFALVARKQIVPTFALFIEMGEEADPAHRLLDRIQQEIRENTDESADKVGDVELTVFQAGDDAWETIVFFEKENTLVVTGDVDLSKHILAFWEGVDLEAAAEVVTEATEEDDEGDPSDATTLSPMWVTPLTDNENFITIMQTCRTAGDEPPHVIWYADPIGLFRNFMRGNAGATVALAMLPSLGLDGVQAAGGSVSFATQRYDDLTHMHLLLDNPRTGILSLANLRSGDITPAPWVPDNIDTYMTGHWDFALTYERLEALIDKFNYEGFFEKNFEQNISEAVEIEFQRDVINQLNGRMIWILGFPQPARFAGRIQLFALEVKDEATALNTMTDLFDRFEDTFEKKSYGGVTYWAFVPRFLRELPEEERPFSPCMTVMEGYAMVCSSTRLLEMAIEARDGTGDRLADALDFRLISSRIRRTSQEPGFILFNRPEETLRFFYDLLNRQETQDVLSGEDNRFFSAVNQALTEHPLPPFEVIAKYFAPSGGLVTDDETGFHYLQFTLRRD